MPNPPLSTLATKLWSIGGGLGAVLATVMLASVCIGVTRAHESGLAIYDPVTVLREIFKALGVVAPSASDDPALRLSIIEFRLPITLCAALTGAALATAGALTQGMFRNPLAAPSIIGVEAGGSLGAAYSIYGLSFGHGSHAVGLPSLTALGVPVLVAQPVGAFVGAVVAVLLVYTVATHRHRTHLPTLLLAGVAISSLAAALTSLVIATAMSRMVEIRKVFLAQMGGFDYMLWSDVAMLLPGTVIGVGGGLFLARELNVLTLGERNAAALGVHLQRVKVIVLACAALAAGSAVSVVGMIGFVGLVVPHIVRRFVGPDHRVLLPACALGGAAFLVAMDLAQRVVCVGWLDMPELRVGVWMGVIGGAFFVYLLVSNRQSNSPD